MQSRASTKKASITQTNIHRSSAIGKMLENSSSHKAEVDSMLIKAFRCLLRSKDKEAQSRQEFDPTQCVPALHEHQVSSENHILRKDIYYQPQW
jgi:hypothetical protein